MKTVFLSVAAMAMLLISSCSKDEISSDNPSEVNEMKSQTTQAYWLNRLKGYDQISMTSSLASLIDSLESEVARDYSQRNTRIRDLGVSISREISESDFRTLFVERNSVHLTRVPVDTSGCSNCQQRLLGGGWFGGGDQDFVIGWPDCNCNWTCGDVHASCSTSDCNPTEMGCGFLWLQSCDGYDSIHPC